MNRKFVATGIAIIIIIAGFIVYYQVNSPNITIIHRGIRQEYFQNESLTYVDMTLNNKGSSRNVEVRINLSQGENYWISTISTFIEQDSFKNISFSFDELDNWTPETSGYEVWIV